MRPKSSLADISREIRGWAIIGILVSIFLFKKRKKSRRVYMRDLWDDLGTN